MIRERYEQIMRCLHVANAPPSVTECDSPTYDKLHKLRWMIDKIRERFKAIWFPINRWQWMKVWWCIKDKTGQQLYVCSYLEGPCPTDHDDSSSWVRVHYYFGFGNLAKHSTIHDHIWNFPRLFMSIFQRNGNEGLRQARPMGKLQALVFHLHSHI
jgi:hypothetical protein